MRTTQSIQALQSPTCSGQGWQDRSGRGTEGSGQAALTYDGSSGDAPKLLMLLWTALVSQYSASCCMMML